MAFLHTNPAERLYDQLTLAQWRERIKDLDPNSPSSAAAVPGLIEIVRNSDAPVVSRRQAALTLGRMRAFARPAVPVLVELLVEESEPAASPEESPPYWAAKALALFGPEASAAAPDLVRLLGDESRPPAHRQAALEALAQIGTAHPAVVPALIERLNSRIDDRMTTALRAQAAEAVGQIGPPASAALPALMRAARDSEENVRLNAVAALGAFGAAAEPALPVLIELLALDDSAAVRDAAGTALGEVGRPAVPILKHLLGDDEPELRNRAAAALGQIGPPAKPAADQLAERLCDGDATVRLTVAEALWKIIGDPQAVVPTLVEELASPDRQQRMRSFRLLTEMGPAARTAIIPLRKLLDHDRADVRRTAAHVLQRIESTK